MNEEVGGWVGGWVGGLPTCSRVRPRPMSSWRTRLSSPLFSNSSRRWKAVRATTYAWVGG